jgi:uncharacterized peroxidase-related enzyme
MSRIDAVKEPQGKVKELLDAVQAQLGMTPNLMTTVARSPVALEAYLGFNSTLSRALTAKLREQIALATAEYDGCNYCASAHTALGKLAGLTEEQTAAALGGKGGDAKSDAALRFARTVLEKRGKVSDGDLKTVRDAGFSDGNIAEIVALVALNVFTNYFNEVAKTDIDFPVVEVSRAAIGVI